MCLIFFLFATFSFFCLLLITVTVKEKEGATSFAEVISFELQSRLERWHLPFLDRTASIVIKAKLISMESGVRPTIVNCLTL
jgi:hypothetical protein